MGPALKALAPTRVVSSDLARAARTGEAVARACGIPISYDPRLREIHAGSWQGRSSAEVARLFPAERAAIARGEDLKRGGDGESVADVAARVRAALADLLAVTGPAECVVVCTHGVAGRVAAATLLGLEQQVAWRILGAFGNCHWSELAEGDHGWRLITWNVSSGMVSRDGSPPP